MIGSMPNLSCGCWAPTNMPSRKFPAEINDEFSGREFDLRRFPNIRFQNFPHLLQGIVVVPFSIRTHAIAWHTQLEIPHIGIIRSKQHANIGSHPGNDQSFRAQIRE